MRSWASKAALFAVLAGPAFATPPQIVDVRDRLFAYDADTLLILREVTDNHGAHTIRQTDTLLVFRSLGDGADRGFRGVERVIERFDGAPRVDYLPLASPENPYAFRAEGGFRPLADPVNGDPATLDGDSLRVLTRGGTVTHALPVPDLTAHIADSLQATRGILPILYIEGGVEPFDPFAFDPVAECAPGAATVLSDVPERPALVKLDCIDGDTGQQASLWIVVPRAG